MKLEAVPGVEIQIECNGVALQEYDDTKDRRDGQLTATGFIEAQSGHTFKVIFQADRSEMDEVLEEHVSASIRLDGKGITRRNYRIRHSRVSEYECQGLKSEKNGQTVLQRFTFSDLATVDEPLGNIQKQDVEYLGEIQVDLRWARLIELDGKRASHKKAKPPMPTDSGKVLPEKALKGRAISSKASLGEAEVLQSASTLKHTQGRSTYTVYPNGDKPFASYIFKYCSRKDLQIEGVIERSPDPVPLEERDPRNMSTQEMQNLITNMRAREKEVKQEKRRHSAVVKAETGDGDDDDGEVTITEARPAKRSQQSVESGGEVEVVDLTDM